VKQAPSQVRAHGSGAHGRLRSVRHQLELRVDADPFWMSALRALTTDLAIRLDFDLDSVADLTLAVDEACAMLIATAGHRDTLVCWFAVSPDRVTVTVTLMAAWRDHRPALRTDTFGWRVMVTLADEVELVADNDGDGTPAIHLSKLRIPVGG
jgi:serine/threonine-protein kinase RsbW